MRVLKNINSISTKSNISPKCLILLEYMHNMYIIYRFFFPKPCTLLKFFMNRFKFRTMILKCWIIYVSDNNCSCEARKSPWKDSKRQCFVLKKKPCPSPNQPQCNKMSHKMSYIHMDCILFLIHPVTY